MKPLIRAIFVMRMATSEHFHRLVRLIHHLIGVKIVIFFELRQKQVLLAENVGSSIHVKLLLVTHIGRLFKNLEFCWVVKNCIVVKAQTFPDRILL